MTDETINVRYSDLSGLERYAVKQTARVGRFGWLQCLVICVGPLYFAWKHDWDFLRDDVFLFAIIAAAVVGEVFYGLGVGRLLRRFNIALGQESSLPT